MEQKKLELLIIEDTESHMKEAKSVMENLVKNGAKINVDYATTLKEYRDKKSNKKYDGIISDIFFPYDGKKESEDSIEGWNSEVASECNKLLTPYFVDLDYIVEDVNLMYSRDPAKVAEMVERAKKVDQQKEDWKKGKSVHPSGLIVGKESFEEGISFQYCSDISGHGSIIEPIELCIYDLAEEENRIFMYSDPGSEDTKKNWAGAYSNVIHQIMNPRMIDKERLLNK